MGRFTAAFLVILFPLLLIAQSHTTGEFNGCPPEGDGGDERLNRLKNRDRLPDSYVTKTIPALVNDAPQRAMDAGERDRDNWTSAQRHAIAAKEATGIMVKGWLAGVTKSPKEACNCHDDEDRDYHLWLVEKVSHKKSKSIVVEISPRMLEDHPDWPALVRRAWREGYYVRISGWRMWDQEHHEQLTKSRATLWEIHPIHRIEVQMQNGRWKDIEEFDFDAN